MKEHTRRVPAFTARSAATAGKTAALFRRAGLLLSTWLAACALVRAAPIVVDLAVQQPEVTVYGADDNDSLTIRAGIATGDLNDDGSQDLILGAAYASGPANLRSGAGEVYVIFGTIAPGSAIDLQATAPDVIVYGADAGDNLGWTVEAADLSGDGIEDLIIGAGFADGPANGRPEAGAAYVFFGPFSSGTVLDLQSAAADVTIHGADMLDNLGFFLAAGDLSGDGRPDLAVGAPAAGGPLNDRDRAGEIHVLFAPLAQGLVVDLGLQRANVAVYGADAGDEIGWSMVIGDVSGDSREDLAAGARMADGPAETRPSAGEVYVLQGPMAPGTEIDLKTTPTDAIVWGDDAGDYLGFSLAIGDLSGDRVGDLIMGVEFGDGPDAAPRQDCGEIAVVFGPIGGGAAIDLGQVPADVRVHGAGRFDWLGHTVEAADFTQDGVDDLLAGAFSADAVFDNRSQCGAAYALFGPLPSGTSVDLASQDADLTVYGADADDELGTSMKVAELTGDGRVDIVLGAILAFGPFNARPIAGEAYVINACVTEGSPPEIGNRLFGIKQSELPRLSWAGYPQAPPVTHYHVRRSTAKQAWPPLAWQEPALRFWVDDAAVEPLYFYEVRAATDCEETESRY